MIVATRLNIGDFVDFSRSDPMFQAFDDEKKTLLNNKQIWILLAPHIVCWKTLDFE